MSNSKSSPQNTSVKKELLALNNVQELSLKMDIFEKEMNILKEDCNKLIYLETHTNKIKKSVK